MPLKKCSTDAGKPGWKYGDAGHCYPYTEGNAASEKRAKKQAIKQSVAIDGGKDLSDAELASGGMKKCANCGFLRSQSQYPDDARTSDGLSKTCVSCRFNSERSYASGTLETVNLDGVDILAAGGPYFGSGSPDEGDHFDEAFLSEIADANNTLRDEVKAPIKIGHSKEQRLLKNSGLYTDEMPAAGWLENFRVTKGKLLVDLKAVPKKLAGLIESGAFRTRSVEMAPVKSQTHDGKEFPTVVTGLALLGAKAPAVRKLDDILTTWYDDAAIDRDARLATTATLLMSDAENDTGARTLDYAQGDVIWDSERGANDWMQDLNAALNASATPPATGGAEPAQPFYVQDVDQLNRRAVVCDWRTNTYWVVPFSMDGDDPVPAPQESWTLAEQAWVEAANDNAAASSGDYTEHVRKRESTWNIYGMDTPSADAGKESAVLTDETIAKFAELFGIDESDAGERRKQVTAKMAEVSKGETSPPPDPTDPSPAPPPAPAPTPSAPPGDTAAAESQLSATRELAERVERIEAKAKSDAIDANINVALSQGRITPKQVDGYRKMGERDLDLMVDSLLLQPPQLELLRAYGSDQVPANSGESRADDFYRAYAGATGVVIREQEGASQ